MHACCLSVDAGGKFHTCHPQAEWHSIYGFLKEQLLLCSQLFRRLGIDSVLSSLNNTIKLTGCYNSSDSTTSELT